MRLRSLLLVVVLALAVAACDARKLDEATLEDQLTSQARDLLEEEDLVVDCPGDVEAESGAIFHCTASTPDGAAVSTLEVTQLNDEGEVEWRVVDASAEGDGG